MSSERSRRLPLILGAVALLVIAVAATVWFVFMPEDDKPVEDLKQDKGTSEEVTVDSLDGTWKVTSGSGEEGTFAGYLVKEVFVSGAREVTASGRSAAVDGSLTVAAGKVTAVKIEVDTTQLTSDEGRRDRAIKDRGLQTNTFPTATFELTNPVALPTDMADGKVSKVNIAGKLTLHGVTKDIATSVDVRPLGDEFTILARIPIAFADYDIEAPSVGGFVEVENEGQIELRINFAKG